MPSDLASSAIAKVGAPAGEFWTPEQTAAVRIEIAIGDAVERAEVYADDTFLAMSLARQLAPEDQADAVTEQVATSWAVSMHLISRKMSADIAERGATPEQQKSIIDARADAFAARMRRSILSLGLQGTA